MTIQQEERPGFVEIAYKVVQATLATLAVYRGARGALNAWKGVYEMIRGPQTEDESTTTPAETQEQGS